MKTSTASTTSRNPLPDATRVSDALRVYLAENGFSEDEYTKPTFRLKVLGRYFDVPNRRDRQWAIPLHDLHHVATGYGTDFVGEGEIGVWELVAGCETWIVYSLNLTAATLGFFLAPRRMLRAIRSARHARSLYRQGLTKSAILDMSLGELRATLGVPSGGVASVPRRLHADAERGLTGDPNAARALEATG